MMDDAMWGAVIVLVLWNIVLTVSLNTYKHIIGAVATVAVEAYKMAKGR